MMVGEIKTKVGLKLNLNLLDFPVNPQPKKEGVKKGGNGWETT